MNSKTILWIEEEVDDKMTEFRVYLDMRGYILDIEATASGAEEKLLNDSMVYDLVLLDLRIDPGNHEKWIERHLDGNKKLGLLLLSEVIVTSRYIDSLLVFSNEYWTAVKDTILECKLSESHFLQKKEAKTPKKLESLILEKFPNMKIHY